MLYDITPLIRIITDKKRASNIHQPKFESFLADAIGNEIGILLYVIDGNQGLISEHTKKGSIRCIGLLVGMRTELIILKCSPGRIWGC
jgi:hypothetical protein